MTVSVDLKEADQKRLSELISTWESSSKSDAIRNAIRYCPHCPDGSEVVMNFDFDLIRWILVGAALAGLLFME